MTDERLTTALRLHVGDCLDVLQGYSDNHFDSVVTDPPYGLSFMGKRNAWDYDVPSEDIWRECLRVLKPGGHLLAFAGTRTQHRMAVRIEDAGFEIRDMIAWVYGSGFPKSLNVGKAIDRVAGAEREVVGSKLGQPGYADTENTGRMLPQSRGAKDGYLDITAPATDAAKQWDGWGTALKPAMEPITVARKPLIGTVAANVLEHGTGAINVDGCRVSGEGYTQGGKNNTVAFRGGDGEKQGRCDGSKGRWPANLIHDGSDEVVGLFPVTTSGGHFPQNGKTGAGNAYGQFNGSGKPEAWTDTGSAARFFYCAKASTAERGGENNHPTVKPTDLMRYLCRLVTPPGGTVLDPFMGSGSTGCAAVAEGFRFVGVDLSESYAEIAKRRIAEAAQRYEADHAQGTFDFACLGAVGL